MHDNNERTIIHDLGAIIHDAFHDNIIVPASVHHHHGLTPNDILIHDHDDLTGTADDHDHYISRIALGDDKYGPTNHNHDELERDDHPSGAIVTPPLTASTDFSPPTAANDPDIDWGWANNIDIITGNNPYNH